MGRFSVRVIHRNGQAASDIGVMIDYGILAGGTVKRRTDRDGWVTFHNSGDDPGDIWVHGTHMGSHGLRDGKTYSFTI
jgi:hypothetical protein